MQWGRVFEFWILEGTVLQVEIWWLAIYGVGVLDVQLLTFGILKVEVLHVVLFGCGVFEVEVSDVEGWELVLSC